MTLFLWKIVGLLLLFGVSAVLSLAETGFMSLSRMQLIRLARARPGRLDFWQQDPDRSLAVILLLNNLVNAGIAVLSVSMALDAAEAMGIPFRVGRVVFPLGVGVAAIALCEILPKVLARRSAEQWALALAPAVRGVTQCLGPSMDFLLRRVEMGLSKLSRTVRTERSQWDPNLIRALLDNAPLGTPLRRMLKNVVGFAQTPVSMVMVPRAEMVTVDLRAGPAGVAERILGSGYSRIPVHRGSVDGIDGMVYSKDLLAQSRSESLIALEDLVRPLPRVLPQTPLAQLLREFRQGRHHMALVSDRHGRVLGLVTLQDTLEAIVGNIAREPRIH